MNEDLLVKEGVSPNAKLWRSLTEEKLSIGLAGRRNFLLSHVAMFVAVAVRGGMRVGVSANWCDSFHLMEKIAKFYIAMFGVGSIKRRSEKVFLAEGGVCCGEEGDVMICWNKEVKEYSLNTRYIMVTST